MAAQAKTALSRFLQGGRKMGKGRKLLLATLLVATALLGVAGYFAVNHLLEEDPVLLPGQNYSSVTSEEFPIPE